MAQPDLSIIIVNWNGRQWLERCLPTLAQQTYPHFEIVVVDNGSEDSSTGWLAEAWPGVRVVALAENTGFAYANNAGIQATAGTEIVTLNNDTRVAPTWLAEMVAALSAPEVGMVAPCIRQWQQPALLDSAGIEVDRAGIAWQRGRNRPVETATQAGEVFGPSAAAALYRREMLAEIGLFDEDFFAYYEDVDLAWRARQAGWGCRYAPEAEVYHWHSASAVAGRKLYLLGRNKLWTLFKNYAPSPLSWGTVLAYDLLSMAYQLGKTRNRAVVRARVDAVRGRQVALAKRPAQVRPVALAPLTPPWRPGGRG